MVTLSAFGFFFSPKTGLSTTLSWLRVPPFLKEGWFGSANPCFFSTVRRGLMLGFCELLHPGVGVCSLKFFSPRPEIVYSSLYSSRAMGLRNKFSQGAPREQAVSQDDLYESTQTRFFSLLSHCSHQVWDNPLRHAWYSRVEEVNLTGRGLAYLWICCFRFVGVGGFFFCFWVLWPLVYHRPPSTRPALSN